MQAIQSGLTLAPASAPPRSAHDALALAVHSMLEFDGMRCVAVSEEAAKATRAAPSASQQLGDDWRGEEVYSFWYRHSSSPALFVVKCLVMGDVMVVHAASDKSDDILCLDLRVAEFVQFDAAQGMVPDKTFSDLEALQRAVRVNITAKLLPSLAKSLFAQPGGCATQAGGEHGRQGQPWRGGDPARPDLRAEPPSAAGGGMAQHFNAGDIGRADLAPGGLVFPNQGGHHPLGPGAIGGGGGSMFGPGHPMFGGGMGGGMGGMGGMGPLGGGRGGGPNWGAPPGARVDPFGPPGVMPFPGGGGGRGGGGMFGRGRQFPDNDIFRPPGNDDDMFL